MGIVHMEGRKSGNPRVHTSIEVVLKEKVLLLHLAKSGVTYMLCHSIRSMFRVLGTYNFGNTPEIIHFQA